MQPIVILKRDFTPPDYFEKPITVQLNDYTMVIDNGVVEATIDDAAYDANPGMRETLHQSLDARFRAVQLFSRAKYELRTPTLVRVRQDGKRDYSVQLKGEVITISGGEVDLLYKDANGNVVSDSRRDRVEKKNSLGDSVSAHAGDELLAALLASNNNAVGDPDNELVHLYEIRDALSDKFGNEAATRSALGLSRPQWSRFGELCNDAPLKQGRHRGKSVGELRDATHGELEEARGFARLMVERYLKLL